MLAIVLGSIYFLWFYSEAKLSPLNLAAFPSLSTHHQVGEDSGWIHPWDLQAFMLHQDRNLDLIPCFHSYNSWRNLETLDNSQNCRPIESSTLPPHPQVVLLFIFLVPLNALSILLHSFTSQNASCIPFCNWHLASHWGPRFSCSTYLISTSIPFPPFSVTFSDILPCLEWPDLAFIWIAIAL